MIDHGLAWLFALDRRAKRGVQIALDGLLLMLATQVVLAPPLAVTLAAPPLTVGFLWAAGLYRAMIRGLGAEAYGLFALGAALATAVTAILTRTLWAPPDPQAVASLAVLILLALATPRLGLRWLHRRRRERRKTRVILYGAGESGRKLLGWLRQGVEYAPVALVDDAPELQGTTVGGLRVRPPGALAALIAAHGASTVLLAMPSASRADRERILADLDKLPVRVQSIPGLAEIVEGRAPLSRIEAPRIEDLLGRDPVAPDPTLLSAEITGKSVLVTGAGGSIGSELCRQILRQSPARLILFEHSEAALYQIEAELAPEAAGRVVPILGSVLDRARLDEVLRQFAVETLFHAAAYKHVPMVERNMLEGLRNNVFGSLTVAEAARAAGVVSVTLISTDKAVRPTNVMGASKRLAELVFQSMAARPGRSRFSMVRFGNVLGSSGSVIPLFRRQIADGGPVTVTHPEMTRYFMTIPEAAQLVLQASALARGGEVFLLDMGQPVRILDLAERMIRLSGKKPIFPDAADNGPSENLIEIRVTGPRPGEKLHEELLIDARSLETCHPRIRRAHERALDADTLKFLLAELRQACSKRDLTAVRQILLGAPIDYCPTEHSPGSDCLLMERPRAAVIREFRLAAHAHPMGGPAKTARQPAFAQPPPTPA